jgi:gluconolactonase
VVYPDPAVEVIDPRFEKYRVGNAAVDRLHTGMRWAEGPVWFADGRYLLFSDMLCSGITVSGNSGAV